MGKTSGFDSIVTTSTMFLLSGSVVDVGRRRLVRYAWPESNELRLQVYSPALVAADIITILLHALIWVSMLVSITKFPVDRQCAAVGVALAIGTSLCLVRWITPVQVNFMVHLGLGIGATLSRTTFATLRDPATSISRNKTTPELSTNADADADADSISGNTTPACDEVQLANNKTLASLIGLVLVSAWALSMANDVVIPHFSTLPAQRDIAKNADFWIQVACVMMFWLIVVYCYVSSTNSIAWEFSCALLSALGCVGCIIFSSPSMASTKWDEILLDIFILLLIFHIGLAAGFCTRRLPASKVFYRILSYRSPSSTHPDDRSPPHKLQRPGRKGRA